MKGQRPESAWFSSAPWITRHTVSSRPPGLRVSKGSKPGRAPYPRTLHYCPFGHMANPKAAWDGSPKDMNADGAIPKPACRQSGMALLPTTLNKRIPRVLTPAWKGPMTGSRGVSRTKIPPFCLLVWCAPPAWASLRTLKPAAFGRVLQGNRTHRVCIQRDLF